MGGLHHGSHRLLEFRYSGVLVDVRRPEEIYDFRRAEVWIQDSIGRRFFFLAVWDDRIKRLIPCFKNLLTLVCLNGGFGFLRKFPPTGTPRLPVEEACCSQEVLYGSVAQAIYFRTASRLDAWAAFAFVVAEVMVEMHEILHGESVWVSPEPWGAYP